MKNFSLQTGLMLIACCAFTTTAFGQYGNSGYGGYGGYGGNGNYGGYGVGSHPVREILGWGSHQGYGYGNSGYGAGGNTFGPNSAIIPGSAVGKEKLSEEEANPELEKAKKYYTKYHPVEPLGTYQSTGYNWWNKVGNDAGVAYWQPGGAPGRVGSPYFYHAEINGSITLDPAFSFAGYRVAAQPALTQGVYGGSTSALHYTGNNVAYGNRFANYGYTGDAYASNSYALAGHYRSREAVYLGGRGRSNGTYHGARHPFSTHPDGLYNAGRDAWGYHFGPGYYRHSEHSHYRFPYYSYRRPWYFQGPASKNRDTNLSW